MNAVELKTTTTNDLKKRSYITFYLDGERIREYNANSIGLDINPNRATSIEERNRLLRELEFALKTSLINNSYKQKSQPKNISTKEIEKTTQELLKEAIDKKLASNLNKFYKRNLSRIYHSFISFLTTEELNSPILDIKKARVEKFLLKFNSSGTYYMNKRRDLGVLFSVISNDIEHKLMTVLNTNRIKSKAILHKIYEREQLISVLDFLKLNHPNLHLCCLLTYGCLLRPHEEIRNLFGYHFKNNFSEIHLSGSENKGGRVRVVYIPDYVKKELMNFAKDLQPHQNLFSKIKSPFNDAYFSTAWKRMWQKMFDKGLIDRNQTIYSFRHTSAVNIYKKTKDLHILQKLLGHSDMIVTLKYLRGLGEINDERLKEVMPEL